MRERIDMENTINKKHQNCKYIRHNMGKNHLESWWTPIKTPEDIHQISDDEINNSWYMQALQTMFQKN